MLLTNTLPPLPVTAVRVEVVVGIGLWLVPMLPVPLDKATLLPSTDPPVVVMVPPLSAASVVLPPLCPICEPTTIPAPELRAACKVTVGADMVPEVVT